MSARARDPRQRPGTVYLVGAGPGDVGLLTLRGARLLRRADVVVHDALVNPGLLRLARSSAEVIDVGKRCGGRRTAQEEINRLLIDSSRSARVVVRLKGGDPFLFGRGGEEAMALRQAGVRFVVVPGVTAAAGVGAYAGIPLTHRELASSVTFVTGHEDTGRRGTRVDWASVAKLEGTVAIYMGVAKLPYIVARLLEAGRSPETPAAVVEWGTYARQRTIAGNLADLPELVRVGAVGAPAIVIIGDVVGLREHLAWFDRLPLRGRRILVGRSRAQSSRLAVSLRRLGAEVVEYPGIRVEPIEHTPLDAPALDTYDWLLFTAPAAVAEYWARLGRAGRDTRAISTNRVLSLGRATTTALRRRGIEPDIALRTFAPAVVVQRLSAQGDLASTRVLFPREEGASSPIVRALAEAGVDVLELPVFRLVMDPTRPGSVQPDGYDLVALASSTSAAMVAPLAHDSPAGVVAIGPLTAAAAVREGLRVEGVAEDPTIEGLVQMVLKRLATHDPFQPPHTGVSLEHLAGVGSEG